MKEFQIITASNQSISNRRLIYGVATNDSNYITRQTIGGKVIVCPFFSKWEGILNRCYNKSYQDKKPTYKGCIVCDDWLTFSNFKRWMESQEWEGLHLDKDLKIPGNKIYSPDTCTFVTMRINSLLVDRGNSRGIWPIGVSRSNITGKFLSRCRFGGKQKSLGEFLTPEEANHAYRIAKSSYVKTVAMTQDEPIKGYLIKAAEIILNKQ